MGGLCDKGCGTVDLRCGDSKDVLKTISDESIDMIMTSPPYDDLRKYKGYSFDFEPIADELARVLKNGGTMVWVVGDQTKNGTESLSSFRQAIYFHDHCKLNVYDTMIYKKKCFVPLSHRRYEQCFEYIFVFTKGKPNAFNGIRVPCKWAGTKYLGSPNLYKDNSGDLTSIGQKTIQDTKLHENIFEYLVGSMTETKKYKHPAMFPLQLAIDQISTWSNVNDTVLDPFCGASTTGVACKQLNREYIGIDISEEYINMSKERLSC